MLVLLGLMGQWVTARADPAPFDLAGPALTVRVTRSGQNLSLAEVPNLVPGDVVQIRADLPASQSAPYLMVVAFLDGATNPPPRNWFFKCETWLHKCDQGLSVVVPRDAQQLMVFLAPHTSGDFDTLIDAVRGRPGAFVRASQDLNQATLDRSRLDQYLQGVRALDQTNPAQLPQAAPLMARSLAIKVNEKCLDRLPELQAPCLMQGQDALVLNDGHSTSIVEALTSGPASDLAMEASYTPQMSYGYYSPYLASILDIARIMGSFHTAQYQYIPALMSALPGDEMALTLNSPPSFHNPKSVLVAALPAIEPSQFPPLHAVDPKQALCAKSSALVLPVEGAPLVFSTRYAHDMKLRLTGPNGVAVELPASADARQGGFVIDTHDMAKLGATDSLQGALHGYWGFEAWEVPGFLLNTASSVKWRLSDADSAAVTVGREDTIHLQASSASCVADVTLKDSAGIEHSVTWRASGPGELEVRLPLQNAVPGAMNLLVSQYGANVQSLPLRSYADPGRLDALVLYAGDSSATLKGTRLDEVSSVAIGSVSFSPQTLTTTQGVDELTVAATSGVALDVKTAQNVDVKVLLKDGRNFQMLATVLSPRPAASLIGRSVQRAAQSDDAVQLDSPDEVPADATLSFSLRSAGVGFGRGAAVEVASSDGVASTRLDLSNGGMTLESAQIAVLTLMPTKALGPSISGPLQFRVVDRSIAGDWQPLATVVRLPQLSGLKCPASQELACKLSGENLYLIQALSSDEQFGQALQVPDGFLGSALPAPRPVDNRLYVKLRDNPSVVNELTVPVTQLPPSIQESTQGSSRAQATQSSEAMAHAVAPSVNAAPDRP